MTKFGEDQNVRERAAHANMAVMHLRIETELEDDGRWIAEIPQLPGVLAYGTTPEEASTKAEILALRILAERLEHAEPGPAQISIL